MLIDVKSAAGSVVNASGGTGLAERKVLAVQADVHHRSGTRENNPPALIPLFLLS